MRRLPGVGAALLLGGCTVGPSYHAPDTPAPPAYVEPSAPERAGPAADLDGWWQAFGDPELDRLVAIALAENLDIKQAASRIRQARFGKAAARAALFPSIDGFGQTQSTRFSKNAGLSSLSSLFGGGGQQGGQAGQGSGSSQSGGIAPPGDSITTYAVGFDASWELDIFGGARRRIEGASAQAEAASWSARDAAVSLLGEVAGAYLQLRVLQQREAIARAEIARQRRSLELIEHTFRAGLVPQGDYIRQRGQLATVQASLDPLIAEERIQMHMLAVLLGRTPESMIAELSVARPFAPPPPDVPPGLPSDLLRRRPDVRAAERRLAAATADIGVAVADLYPKFDLTGIAELISTSLANLFTGNSVQLIGSARASFPLLDFGRRRAQVGIRREQAEQAYLDYQKAVLGGFKDVEDALIRISTERERNRTLRAGLADASRSAAAVDARYRSGLVDFSAVLAAQQQELQIEDSLASSDGTLRTDLASLFKALGGGWGGLPPAPDAPLRDRPYIASGKR